MQLQFNLATIILAINTFFIASFTFYAWKRWKVKGGIYFAILMTAISVWSATSMMESISIKLSERVFWSQLEYFGIVVSGPAWLIFSLIYSEQKVNLIKKAKRTVWYIPVISLLLVLTNDYHHLIWTSFVEIKSSTSYFVVYNHGIFFFLIIAYIYLTLLLGSLYLIRYMKNNPKLSRVEGFLLLLGCLIPWIGNVLYVFGRLSLDGIDLTPLTFSFTGLIFILIIFKQKNSLSLDTAQDAIYQNLESGYIVIDGNKNILEFNAAATTILGSNLMIGNSFKSIEPNIDNFVNQTYSITELTPRVCIVIGKLCFEVQLSNFNNQTKKLEGKVLFLYDITDQRNSQMELITSRLLMENIINFLPDPTIVIDPEGRVKIWNNAIEKLTKVPAKDIIGKNGFAHTMALYGENRPSLIDFVLHPEDQINLKKYYPFVEKQGNVYLSEVTNTFLGDKKMFFFISTEPLFNNEGKIIGAIETFKDLSKVKEIEINLQKKLQELSKLNDLMINREMRIIELKRAIRDLQMGKPLPEDFKVTAI